MAISGTQIEGSYHVCMYAYVYIDVYMYVVRNYAPKSVLY